MRTLVLDTGALAAVQRDPVRFLALLDVAAERNLRLRTTAPVLTEFLGGSPRSLRARGAYVTSRLRVGAVDEHLARRAALLRQVALDQSAGRTEPSAIDALVVADAEVEGGLAVYDGDRADFEALVRASGEVEAKALTELTKR